MDWAADWVSRNHCRIEDVRPVGEDVTVFAWGDCAAQTDVVQTRIEGAGHTWPGELANSGPGSATQTVSATEEMWKFFVARPLNGPAA